MCQHTSNGNWGIGHQHQLTAKRKQKETQGSIDKSIITVRNLNLLCSQSLDVVEKKRNELKYVEKQNDIIITVYLNLLQQKKHIFKHKKIFHKK